MPKKSAKGKLDATQRTLLHFGSFKQPRGTAPSPSKCANAQLAKRAKSDSHAIVRSHSALCQKQAASDQPESQVMEMPQMLQQESSVQEPVDSRRIAQAELKRSMTSLNCEQKGEISRKVSQCGKIATFAYQPCVSSDSGVIVLLCVACSNMSQLIKLRLDFLTCMRSPRVL